MNTNKIPRIFEPTSEELIHCYLWNKIMNNELADEVKKNIPVVTIYGENLNPWEKFCSEGNTYPWKRGMDDMGNYEDYDILYVFTKVTNVGKKNGNNFQKNRMAGDGTWHGNHKKAVKLDGVNIGYSRLLTFESSNGQETLGHWTMNEYTIDPAVYGLLPSDWVVCKIKKHHGKSSVDGKVIRVSKKIEESSKSNKKKRRQIMSEEVRGRVNDAVPMVNLDNYDVHQVGENFPSTNQDDGWKYFNELLYNNR